jgi:hypothetical protein
MVSLAHLSYALAYPPYLFYLCRLTFSTLRHRTFTIEEAEAEMRLRRNRADRWNVLKRMEEREENSSGARAPTMKDRTEGTHVPLIVDRCHLPLLFPYCQS